MKNFDAGLAEYDIIKHFDAFYQYFVFFHLKSAQNTLVFQKWLDNLLFMTSYLVTIVTNSHQIRVEKCLRNMLLKRAGT